MYSATEGRIGNKKVILAGTNNYLGLTFNHDAIREGQAALAAQGTGTTVRMVGIPQPLLTCLADISTALSRLAGKEPMLTRSKIRELTHADWSASNNRISEDINWFPGISLEHALRNGLF